MNKEETKKWEEFVIKELCPAKCGHLRFKLKKLIEEAQKAQQEDILKKIEEMEKEIEIALKVCNNMKNDRKSADCYHIALAKILNTYYE